MKGSREAKRAKLRQAAYDIEVYAFDEARMSWKTITGRLGCRRPSLQNLPVRTEEGARIGQTVYAGVSLFGFGDIMQRLRETAATYAYRTAYSDRIDPDILIGERLTPDGVLSDIAYILGFTPEAKDLLAAYRQKVKQ